MLGIAMSPSVVLLFTSARMLVFACSKSLIDDRNTSIYRCPILALSLRNAALKSSNERNPTNASPVARPLAATGKNMGTEGSMERPEKNCYRTRQTTKKETVRTDSFNGEHKL